MGVIKNIVYLKNILRIGGVETFVYELCKKYHEDYEIVVFYDKADDEQLRRLQKYVRCEKFDKTHRYQCEKFITNYAIDMIENVDAKEYIEVLHCDYMRQIYTEPHIHKKINRYIAVSEEVAKSWKKRTGIKCEVCANPLTYDESGNGTLLIVAAQRLSSEKGVKRIVELSKRLDKESDIKYLMLIYTNQNQSMYASNIFDSPNVATLPSNLDIRHMIATCDLFLVLSDSEGRAYSVAEKLASGHGKLLATPLPVFEEIGADKHNTIYLDFDMSNMNEVIEKIREIYRNKVLSIDFKPVEVKDRWNKILAKGKSDYKPVRFVSCRATKEWVKHNIILAETGTQPTENELLILTEDRYEYLHNDKKYNCCLVTDKIYLK